jgi:nitrogen-specific signal transduction histidine kinase
MYKKIFVKINHQNQNQLFIFRCMFRDFFNWRSFLAAIAILIVIGTIIYSGYITKQIEREERKKIELWIEAKKTEITTDNTQALNLAGIITTKNTSIPIIWANENDSIIDFVNGDTNKIKSDTGYATRKLKEYKDIHPPIIWINPLDSTEKSKLYFGNSKVIAELKWYPIIQLIVVALFIITTLLALQSRNRSTQNQVWAGMAKETAHQLGTPLSSLQGWVEVLKDQDVDETILQEVQKDINRLDLISDRFGKIGSIPKFVETDVLQHIRDMADYMKKRASGKILIEVHAGKFDETTVPLSPQLFDWVIENLIKNALDALDGRGSIHIYIYSYEDKVIIDVADTGKGIPRNKWNSIFKPGYTTKKRGWGLGLSLTKRIVDQYHQGKIYVKDSELNKGTTFRIVLPTKRSE